MKVKVMNVLDKGIYVSMTLEYQKSKGNSIPKYLILVYLINLTSLKVSVVFVTSIGITL